jgi:hypothetical protein
MKSLAILGAVLAVSLTLAGTASARSVTTRTTVTDDFGNQVTTRRTLSDNGFQRCMTVTRSRSNVFGGRASASRTVCRL